MHWADYAFPVPRYGQYTSNLVEQQNWVYLKARELPVFEMLQHIWADMMAKVFKRGEDAKAGISVLPPRLHDIFRIERDNARHHEVVPSSRTQALVTSCVNRWQQHTVTLDYSTGAGSCTCGHFQNEWRPCEHGHAFLELLREPSIAYVSNVYTRGAWIATYSQVLPPIRCNDLEFDSDVMPPATKKRQGRLAKKRFEAQGSKQRSETISDKEYAFNDDLLDNLLGDSESEKADSEEAGSEAGSAAEVEEVESDASCEAGVDAGGEMEREDDCEAHTSVRGPTGKADMRDTDERTGGIWKRGRWEYVLEAPLEMCSASTSTYIDGKRRSGRLGRTQMDPF